MKKLDFNHLEDLAVSKSINMDDYIAVAPQPNETNTQKGKLQKGQTIKTAFDEYTLIEQIGSGGNGRVFSATNLLEEIVAIKFFERVKPEDKKRYKENQHKFKRFKNEINFCEKHEHKNIVKVTDRGYAYLDDTDYVFYIMPYYPETLRKKMQSGISPDDPINIIVGILNGLKFAHDNKVIHRDIKPENILFEKDSIEPIICDFGIAHFSGEDKLTVVKTKPNDRMANFQYAAPEQREKGGIIKPQTDVFAVGLILNEMFTGKIPQIADYKRIGESNKDYQYLDNIVDQLLKTKPDERLYPIDKILLETQLLAENAKRTQDAELLKGSIAKNNKPIEYKTELLRKEYKDESIYFYLKHDYPTEWFEILYDETRDYIALCDLNPPDLDALLDNKFVMRLHGIKSKELIKDISDTISQSIPIADEKYSKYLKQQAEKNEKRAERRRIERIENLNFENELNKMLNDM